MEAKSVENSCLLIRIHHELCNSLDLDKAIAQLRLRGFNVISYSGVDTINDVKKKDAQKLKGRYLISAYTQPIEDKSKLSEEDYNNLADSCLDCVGDNSFLCIEIEETVFWNSFSNEKFYHSVFYKGSPTLKCGIIVRLKSDDNFESIKSILESYGFSNIKLNEEAIYYSEEPSDIRSFMKIDLEMESFKVQSDKPYPVDSKIDFHSFHFNRYGIAYRRNLSNIIHEEEWARHLRVVPVKRNNSFDFSGDDSSLDPRHW